MLMAVTNSDCVGFFSEEGGPPSKPDQIVPSTEKESHFFCVFFFVVFLNKRLPFSTTTVLLSGAVLFTLGYVPWLPQPLLIFMTETVCFGEDKKCVEGEGGRHVIKGLGLNPEPTWCAHQSGEPFLSLGSQIPFVTSMWLASLDESIGKHRSPGFKAIPVPQYTV